MHHGGYFNENPKEYVGGDVGVVDDCDPNKWSKVKIEAICKDFGYTSVSRLWYKMPGDNKDGRMFHLINDDHDVMFMTDLVRGHGQIHVYVEHPIHEPILINGGNCVTLDLVVDPEDVKPLDVNEYDGYTSNEPEPAYDGFYNGQGYFCSSVSNDEGVVMMIGIVIRTCMSVVWMLVGMVVRMRSSMMVVVIGMVINTLMRGCRDVANRNHDSEDPTTPTNVHDNQRDLEVKVLRCKR